MPQEIDSSGFPRSKSMIRHSDGKEEPITDSTRNPLLESDRQKIQDLRAKGYKFNTLRYAILSFETGNNFAPGYAQRMQADGNHVAVGVSANKALDARVISIEQVRDLADIRGVAPHLFANKSTPDIVFCLEIPFLNHPLIIHGQCFKKLNTIKGKTQANTPDQRQDFCAYVRQGMERYFRVEEHTINLENQSGVTVKHNCMLLLFSVGHGNSIIKKYGHFIVHLPNSTIGKSTLENHTRTLIPHHSFDGSQILTFDGDTNMKSMPGIVQNFLPSISGRAADGSYFYPVSSGAKKVTRFMRRESVSGHVDGIYPMQASTLNRAFVSQAGGLANHGTSASVSIDHPSIMCSDIFLGKLKEMVRR